MLGSLSAFGRPALALFRYDTRTSCAPPSQHFFARNPGRLRARVAFCTRSRLQSLPTSSLPEETTTEAMPRELNEALTILERGIPEPKVHKGRTLILCFDGTSNHYHDRNSNVVRLFSCLEKREPQQLVYYQTGIGTSTRSRFGIRLGSWISKMIDQGTAWHLENNVCSGYHFLQVNWRPGDKICLFGFSRGAYIARALAGMIQTVGLLPDTVPEQVEFAYKLYRTLGQGSTRYHPSRDYKRDFSRHVNIDFLGVWDTVASAGLIFPQSLPFSQTSSAIKVFRQALALDERRVKFIPSTWMLAVEEQTLVNDTWRTTKTPADFAASNYSENLQHWILGMFGLIFELLYIIFVRWWVPPSLRNARLGNLARPDGKGRSRLIPAGSTSVKVSPPDVKEVWFAGGHGDVGGGNSMNAVKIKGRNPRFPILDYVPTLSNIPLRWMIRELYEADKRCNLNIRWRPVQLARYGVYLPPLPLTNNGHPNGSSPLETSLDEGTQKTRWPIPPPCTQPPVITHFTSTPEAAQMRQNDPRRAGFIRCLKYESGVLVDLQHHEADLRTPITDQLWMWERIWKWEGTPSLSQAMKWMANSTNTMMIMILWWILELWPYVKSVRSGTRYFWQSKFEMGISMFRGREISPSEFKVDIPEGASPQWKQFIQDRTEVRVHDSVIARTKEKSLGYWPRPWPKQWKEKGLPGKTWKVTY